MFVDETKGQPVMKVIQTVMDEIEEFIGRHYAERGGMLGCNADGIITHFAKDTTAYCSGVAYDPDIAVMNSQIQIWKEHGIHFAGFVHSHPRGIRNLSGYDHWYAGEIMNCFKGLDVLWLPLVQTVPDTGKFEFLPLGFKRNAGNSDQISLFRPAIELVSGVERIDVPIVKPEDVRQVEGEEKDGLSLVGGAVPWRFFGHCADLGGGENSDKKDVETDRWQELINQQSGLELRDRYLKRRGDGWNLDLLDRTRVIVIGTGGAAGLLRNMARMGVGEFVLIDPDIVSETNVATQQVQPEDVGLSKVEALGRDIVKLNPGAAVFAVNGTIESIDDAAFKALLERPVRYPVEDMVLKSRDDLVFIRDSGLVPLSKIGRKMPERTVLMVLTDNFYAQARGHRLGLQFGLPTICAQEYREGRGAEVTYTVPGVTTSCHRCITSSRYQAYLEEGFRNDVSSEGAPIFAAEYLNAVLGHIFLGIAHHGTSHSRWGGLVEKLANRNLIQLRLDPDFDLEFGLDVFGRRQKGAAVASSLLMFDSLFLEQTPDRGQTLERPVCPDCGGCGDLREVVGTFSDTRDMRLRKKAVA